MRVHVEFDRAALALSLRFEAGRHETHPFVDHLWFWGCTRAPDITVAGLAACLAAARLPVSSVDLPDLSATPWFCRMVRDALDLDVQCGHLDSDNRGLLGGDNTIYPYRFADGPAWHETDVYHEPLSWTGIDEFRGRIGGAVRSNIDMFPLPPAEKDLIVALCCGGTSLGSVVAPDLAPDRVELLHRLGLGVIGNPSSP